MKLKYFQKLQLKSLILALIVLNGALLVFLLNPNIKSQFGLAENSNEVNVPNQNLGEVEQIRGSNWDFQKLTEFFKSLSTEKGGEYAFDVLIAAANKNYLTANVDTHLLGHVVGDMLYKQKGIDGIKGCTQDLRNACSHSIVVGALLEMGLEALPKTVATCEQAPGGSGAYMMCIHGLGHGVLAYTEYDMHKAVELCDKTGTEKKHRQEVGQCVGGVTMEMMSGINDRVAWAKQAPNYFKDNDPLAPCNMGFIPQTALSYCYQYLTPHLFEAAGTTLSSPDPKYFAKAMGFCLKLPKTDPSRTTCLASFGKEFVVLANYRNIESVTHMSDDQLKTIYDWCHLGPEEAVTPCLNSSMHSLYWGGENDREVSVRFCTNMTEAESQICFNELITAVSHYKRTDVNYQKAFCAEVPIHAAVQCKQRLRV